MKRFNEIKFTDEIGIWVTLSIELGRQDVVSIVIRSTQEAGTRLYTCTSVFSYVCN